MRLLVGKHFSKLSAAVTSRCAISIYVAALMFEAVSIPLAIINIPHFLAVSFLVFQIYLLFLPISSKTPSWAVKLNTYALASYEKWCDFQLVYEASKELTFLEGRSYVIGYEPHSVLPFGLPLVFSRFGPKRTKIEAINTLATSMVDWCPIVRHLFYWLGGRAASRKNMHELLGKGGSVAVIPGGVAECVHMAPGKDVVYLRSRKGFVKVAMQHGASLVPVFCFGQNYVYRFWRLGAPLIPVWLVDKIVRTILFCPMIIYGYCGTPLPHRVQLYMVIGTPISLQKNVNPTSEEVSKHLDAFIDSMQQMYEKHKAAAGYPNSELMVL